VTLGGSASAAPAGAPDGGDQVRDGRALGSPLRLTVHGTPAPASALVDAAWAAVLSEFDAADRALSRYRDDSELTSLNRQAGSSGMLPVGPRLRAGIALADRARRVTGGRFDAEVHHALEILGERAAFATEPVHPAVRPARAGMPSSTPVPARPIDLGGIGKGLGLRWAARAARGALPHGAGILIACGGDVVAAGDNVQDVLVGIEDPRADAETRPLAVVPLASGRAIATSSVRVRRWAAPDGALVHHLIDPRTQEPARTGLAAVTVLVEDPAWAEIWTKSLFLAGRDAIGTEARARDLAAWWVDDAGRLGMTARARQVSTWVAEDRLGG
jgi:FAD:protein FMN transferase